MNKKNRSALIVLVIVVLIAFFYRQHRLAQDQRIQFEQYLNKAFNSIQVNKNRVLLTLRPRSNTHAYPPLFAVNSPGQRKELWTEGTRSFSPGETFQISDIHYSALYTIISIKRDGVVISYKTTSSVRGEMRRTAGSATLSLKK